ncbi:hypothetical protein D9611_006858 [Ephemerocybe angulata]|uniref:Glycine cleavage system H protein n=1 Tax=Ephemerocybe angulata TaxID=980116 RepID=A0A8H5EVM2_9AGAR|nr:hypothetical protein D9611_006858 [Tulosesus angulatus]
MQSIFRASALRAAARPSRAFARPSASLYRSTQIRTLVTKKYTKDHEAVVFDDATGVGIVSVTDYAQSSLGDVVFVELPAVGADIAQGDQIGAVESVKAASDIYAPVSGKIEAINDTLSEQPGLLNKSPEDKGWLCKIKLTEPAELEALLSAEEYKAHCEADH